MTHRILVVDDEDIILEMVAIALTDRGYAPVVCNSGTDALSMFRDTNPDLVLLDIQLPGRDGIEICRDIRAESGTPIIMLTANGETESLVLALEAGADDYIVKPYKAEELTARIRARLRPAVDSSSKILGIGDLTIDVTGHEVRRNGELLSLTPLEFDLLVALASQPAVVFTREMLLEQVWGYQYKADTRLVNVHVQRLRGKIEEDPDNPRVVMTVRGVGYRAGSVV
jgi:two-component system, OmpR family, response regulator MtrA